MGFWFDDTERQIIAQEQTTAAIKAQTQAIEIASMNAQRDASDAAWASLTGSRSIDVDTYKPLSAEDRSMLRGGALSAIAIIGGCIIFVAAVLKGFLFLLKV